MFKQDFAGGALARTAAGRRIATTGQLERRLLARDAENLEEGMIIDQLQLRGDPLCQNARAQQAVLRLVEFLVGDAGLALYALEIGDPIRLARDFERSARR